MGVCDHLDIEQDTHLGKSWTMKIGYLDIDSLPHQPSKSLDYCQTHMIEFHYLLQIGSIMITVGSQFTTAKSGVTGTVQEIVKNDNGTTRVRLDVAGTTRWTTVKGV